MKTTIALIVTLSAASLVMGQTPAPDKSVRLLIGLDAAKRNAMGSIMIHDGVMEFKTANDTPSKVPVSAVNDVFIGTETTQTRGKTATVVKAAGHAAPYGSGRALSLMMRNKVDILTVSFHDTDGSLHGAIFALPIGQAEAVRAQLVQAGAHASPVEE
jgi:hypothetical protein